ncbi:MAG: head-tail adaptor protein [Sphingomonas phyllosphaerae]|uniref:phage head completion protein n=1 Tax=Sphingomonas phyllosphaerae TaxID=257003 RepID=UPI002FF753CD
MARVRLGRLDRRVRIERPVASASFTGAGAGTWAKVADTRASIQDALPSRGERLADGLNATTRPARVRMRYRTDVTAAMRIVLLRYDGATDTWVPADRIMQITTVPAELGRRDGLEMMVEDYSPAGNAA